MGQAIFFKLFFCAAYGGDNRPPVDSTFTKKTRVHLCKVRTVVAAQIGSVELLAPEKLHDLCGLKTNEKMGSKYEKTTPVAAIFSRVTLCDALHPVGRQPPGLPVSERYDYYMQR